MSVDYDRIGIGYAARRRGDPRIAARIASALGAARTLVNVGAGAGAYEPSDRTVIAVEPSRAMIRQRPPGAGPAVRGRAEALPFADRSVDAACAFLTVHHWTDPARGLGELRRVARGPVVLLTVDPAFEGFWLADYFPGLRAIDRTSAPPLALYAAILGEVEIAPVPIPEDCADGFLAAYWGRPEAYLDPTVRAAMSPFQSLEQTSSEALAQGLAQLATDLESGEWARRYAAWTAMEAADCGYRLVVAA